MKIKLSVRAIVNDKVCGNTVNMVIEHFLDSKLGVPYSFMYYGCDSFQEIIDELEREGQVELIKHQILYDVNQSLVYSFEDGRVVVFTGGSLFLFEARSYSIWRYESDAIDKAIRKFPEIQIEGKGNSLLKAYKISDFLTGIILEFGNFEASQSNEKRDVYLTPNGWLVIQDLVKFENFILLEDEAKKFCE